jgi:N-acetylneuraminic acid mutarotase
MYYDSARAKVELFGGTSPAQIAFADTWEYDPATAAWTQRTTTTKPPARAGHTFVFDGATGRGVLAAGVAYSQAGIHSPEFDDIWEYDGAAISWTQRGADVAPALSRPGMVYDTARQTLVLRGDEARPSMWELSAGRWSAKPMLAGLNLDYGLAFSSDTTTLAPSGAQHNELASASLVYDPARARTMLFAGWDPPLYAVDPGRPPEVWEWDGLRWQQRQCTGAPLGLHSAGIAFDAKRERVVIAGGQTTSSARGAPPFFQTWEMDPATCTWTLRNPSIQPPARLLPMMAWDSTRNVVLMFGGGSALADTWEWDGAAGTWSQRTRTSGPPGRARGGLAYDSGRARFVLFGGIGASASTISPDGAALNDLWEYDASAGTWSSVNTAIAPSPRSDVSFAYDPNRAAVALFGGMGQQNSRHGFYQVPQSDLWEWNGMRWAQRTLGSNPVARSGASVGWFPTPRTGMMFGGVRGDGERAFLNDTWLWRSGEWARVSDVGADTVPTRPIRDYGVTKWLPPARAGHAFAVEVLTGGDEIYGVLFGGEGDTGLLDDTWLWDRDQFLWEPLPSAITPPARTGHSLAAIPDRGVLLFGGTGVTGELLGDTYLSIGSGWMPELFGPPPRTSHAMATDLLRGKIVLFGGRGANGALQDTWEWDTQGASGWTQRSAATSPPARFGHSMFYDPNRATIVMVGGAGDDSTSDYGDAWEWNGQAGTWSKLFVTVDLSPRAGALAFFDENRGNPVLFGGLGYRVNGTVATSYGDTWALVRANELPRNGLACTQNNGCGSGFCVDGYCCNTACTDQCTACDVPVVLGTCTPVTGAPHGPRVACPGSPACSTCNGSDTKACHQLAAGTVCTAAACSAGVATTAGACNGSGACLPGSATSCAPYGCAPGVCYTTCGPNAPCPSGDFCNQTSPSNPVCSAYSRFASVTYSPVPTIVNNVVTVTATMSSADAPIFRPIYVTPDNHNLTATCQAAKSPSGWVGTCVFTPTMVGTYTFVLHVASAGSPNLPYDDDQTQLSITVTP